LVRRDYPDPWCTKVWLATGAEVELVPVMTMEDLERGMQALGPKLSKYTNG
jgi:hypothetical protein